MDVDNAWPDSKAIIVQKLTSGCTLFACERSTKCNRLSFSQPNKSCFTYDITLINILIHSIIIVHNKQTKIRRNLNIFKNWSHLRKVWKPFCAIYVTGKRQLLSTLRLIGVRFVRSRATKFITNTISNDYQLHVFLITSALQDDLKDARTTDNLFYELIGIYLYSYKAVIKLCD